MPRYIDLDKLNEYPIRLNHYDKENGNVNFVYGIESVLEYANSLPVFETDWISVKDKMPEKDGNYLCYLECGDICQSTFNSTIASIGEQFPFGEVVSIYDSHTLGFVDSYWEEHDAITHWQSLPEPPKEVQDDA